MVLFFALHCALHCALHFSVVQFYTVHYTGPYTVHYTVLYTVPYSLHCVTLKAHSTECNGFERSQLMNGLEKNLMVLKEVS